ncbi:MAG: hypothetical protein ACPLYF_04505, partial [Fervidobacterium sp.]
MNKGVCAPATWLERDYKLETVLTQLVQINRSTKSIADYLAGYIGAKFHGLEKETLLKVVREMKVSVRRYNTLVAYKSGGYVVLGFPVSVKKYDTVNRVTYRYAALMTEGPRGYVVVGTASRIPISREDGDKLYAWEVSARLFSFFENSVVDYSYEVCDREAHLDLTTFPHNRARIRLQGDLMLEYEILSSHDLLDAYVRGEVVGILRRLVVRDVMRAISRKLSIMRVEHGIEDTTIVIPYNFSGGFRKKAELEERVARAFEKFLAEMGLRKDIDFSEIRARHRCPFGLGRCHIEVFIRLNGLSLVERFGNELI